VIIDDARVVDFQPIRYHLTDAVAERHQPLAFFPVLQRRPLFGTVNQFEVLVIGVEVFHVEPVGSADSKSRMPEDFQQDVRE